jgi:hypothetical protein
MGGIGGRPRKYASNAERARAYRQRKRQARLAQAVSVHFKHETTLWSTPNPATTSVTPVCTYADLLPRAGRT